MDQMIEQGSAVQGKAATDQAPERAREEAAPGRFLDRPLLEVVSLNWEIVAWALLLALAAVARFYGLGLRAMSHDESLHALYSYYLYDAGNYEHNPMMHGPLLFHVNAVMYFLFGDSDATARLGPALAGIGVVWMAYPYRRYLGRLGALAAGVMLTISPSLLFHSRYIRNDIYIALFVMVWIYGAFRYLDAEPGQRKRWLAVMVLGMAPAFVTKENAFMAGALIGAFFAGLALWRSIGTRFFVAAAPALFGGGVAFWLYEIGQKPFALASGAVGLVATLALLIIWLRGDGWSRLRSSRGAGDAADLAVVMLTLVLPFTAPIGHALLGWDAMASATNTDILRSAGLVLLMTLISVGIAFYWFALRKRESFPEGLPWNQWAGAMGAFWLVQILFFTTFLTNVRNGFASGVVGSLGYWLAQQEVARGGQPWYYYLMLSGLYEFLPMLLALGGIITIVARSADAGWDPVAPRDLPADVAEEARRDLARADVLLANRLAFMVFGVWWVAGSWAAYTVAGEKMPWLLTHLALPMCIVGGWWLAWVGTHIDWTTARRSGTLWLAALTPALILVSVTLVRESPFGGRDDAATAATMQWIVAALAFVALVYLGVRLGRAWAGAWAGAAPSRCWAWAAWFCCCC